MHSPSLHASLLHSNKQVYILSDHMLLFPSSIFSPSLLECFSIFLFLQFLWSSDIFIPFCWNRFCYSRLIQVSTFIVCIKVRLYFDTHLPQTSVNNIATSSFYVWNNCYGLQFTSMSVFTRSLHLRNALLLLHSSPSPSRHFIHSYSLILEQSL